MKISKRVYIISIIISLLPIAVGIILYDQLPDQLPSHWSAAGEINDYSSKSSVLFVTPVILAVVSALLPVLMKLDPKNQNMSDKLFNVLMFVLPILSNIIIFTTIATILKMDFSVNKIMTFAFGVMFIFLGNFMPKTKQSYSLGIRLPWTLNSEENWNRTHRFAGLLWVMGGILIVTMSLLPIENITPVMISVILVIAVIPCIYSFVLYRKGI